MAYHSFTHSDVMIKLLIQIYYILQATDTHFCVKHKCDAAFLRKAITAHLVTGGTSVVVGPKADSVNMVNIC